MAWLAGDRFIAVHDAKESDAKRARVSLLQLPRSRDGLHWQPLAWPERLGLSNDLESIARIPGTDALLLVESGDDDGRLRRIFLARYQADTLQVASARNWPVAVTNVEGSAVARLGRQWVFLYAERAHGQPGTALAWAPLDPVTLEFGAFQQVLFTPPDPTGPDARPVSALEVDQAGYLYAASAVDPRKNNGPFRSVVWRIGRIQEDKQGNPQVVLYSTPQRLATLDGLKVESLAIREPADGPAELFIGTDDENYGGIVRLVVLPPSEPGGQLP